MKSILRKVTCFVATLLLAFGGAFGVTPKTAAAEENAEVRYYDVPAISARASAGDLETIAFDHKEDSYIGTPNNVPYYFNLAWDNGCGPVAGSVVVGYYDKYYENLIPNYTNYYTATGKYRPQDSTYVPNLIQDLYTDMQTNVAGPGVSEAECLDGLEIYVEGKGYSINYTTVKSVNGSFNHTAYQNAINNGQPVLMFCEDVVLYELFLEDTQDRFCVMQVAPSHIVVGFGYKTIRYYDANNNNFRTDIYLKVASGWYPNTMGYMKINEDSWLDSAYAVDIY